MAEQESMKSQFDRNKVMISPREVTLLAERLSTCSEITRFDEGEHREAWALADSFVDLESSFRKFLDEILPKLVSSQGDDLYNCMLETAENFRHVLYHILVQQKFFRYVAPTLDTSWRPPKVAKGD